MKNKTLYTLSALCATCLLVLWVLNIIQPLNNAVALLLILTIILGYTPIIGEILSEAYSSKKE